MRFLTTPEAAAQLGISQQRIRQLIAAGRLPVERYGRAHLITPAALAALRPGKPGRPRQQKKANTRRSQH